MNNSTLSSYGFFALAMYAARHGFKDIWLACLLCGATSVMNHVFCSNQVALRAIDMFIVRLVAAYFALVRDRSATTMLAAVGTVLVYALLKCNDEWYFITQACAYAGIWYVIQARVTKCTTKSSASDATLAFQS